MSADRIADAEDCKTKGNACLSAGDFDKAIQWYTQAIQLHDANHVYYSNRSAAYLSKNYADSALKDAKKCVSLNPTWAKGYSRVGAALHKLKRYDEAIQAYEKGLALEPNNAGCKQGLEAVVFEKENPYGDAEGLQGVQNMFANIMSTVQRSPKLSRYLSDPEFANMINTIQANPSTMSNYMNDPRMMEVFAEMIGADPEMSRRAEETAKQRAAQEEKEKAEKLRREKEKAERDRIAAEEKAKAEFEALSPEEKKKVEEKREAQKLKAEGNELYKERNFDEAIAKYDAAIELDGEDMSFLTNKAAVVLEKGDLEGCIQLCNDAIKVGRAHYADYSLIAKAYARQGNAYLKHKKYAEAVDAYKRAQLEKKSGDVDLKLKKAEKKMKEAAEREYRDPAKGLEAKERGNELFKAADFPGAIREYSEAIKRDPECAVYYNNRAAAYMKVMDFGRAMDDIKVALRIDKNYVKAWSRKGNIELFLKEYHKALDSFKQGLALEPGNAECASGLERTQYQIRIQSTGGGNTGETKEEREQRARRAMEDPEIRGIMSDPVMKQVLQDMSTDPSAAQRHLSNPEIASKVEKLMAAGILHTA